MGVYIIDFLMEFYITDSLMDNAAVFLGNMPSKSWDGLAIHIAGLYLTPPRKGSEVWHILPVL